MMKRRTSSSSTTRSDPMIDRRTLLSAAAASPLLYVRAFADTPKDTIVMAKRIDDIISLDPQEAFEYSGTEISGNVYEKLVTPDDAEPTKIVPNLAESWTTSADGKSWIFKI